MLPIVVGWVPQFLCMPRISSESDITFIVTVLKNKNIILLNARTKRVDVKSRNTYGKELTT